MLMLYLLTVITVTVIVTVIVNMTSFIKEYLFEVNEFPKYGKNYDFHTIKDYFFYDSNTTEYGYRQLILPTSQITNAELLPGQQEIKRIIEKKIPVLRRDIDFRSNTEIWSFDDSFL
jgi:hypothetical protein